MCVWQSMQAKFSTLDFQDMSRLDAYKVQRSNQDTVQVTLNEFVLEAKVTVHFLFTNYHIFMKKFLNLCTYDTDSDPVSDASVAEMLLEKKKNRQETITR